MPAAAIGMAIGSAIAGAVVPIVDTILTHQDNEKAQRELRKAQAKVQKALDDYNDREDVRQTKLKTSNFVNQGYDSLNTNDLAQALNTASATFKLSSIQMVDAYVAAVESITSQTYQSGQDALVAFSSAMTQVITETAQKNLAQIGVTEGELSLLLEQYKADSEALLANYVSSSSASTEEMKDEMQQAINTYDQQQQQRNANLEQALASSTSSFAQLAREEATLRNKIVGDTLAKTGQVLANTNDGVAAIVGTTPEENLQAAQSAAADFSSALTAAQGTQASNAAQQAARQAGTTRGQAALMSATAGANTVNEASPVNMAMGLEQYRTAQQQQTEALEAQYARQKELADAQVAAAQQAEERNTSLAKQLEESQRDNAALIAQQQQADQLTLLEQRQQAARDAKEAEEQTAQNAATLEQGAKDKALETENQNAKDLMDATLNANSEAAQNLQNAELARLQGEIANNESRKASLENSASTALQTKQMNEAIAMNTDRENALTNYQAEDRRIDKIRADTRDEIDAERQQDYTNIDTMTDLADQRAGLATSAADRRAQSYQSLGNAVGTGVTNTANALGNYMEADAASKAGSTPTTTE